MEQCPECGSDRIEKLILYRCPDCGAEYTQSWEDWISVEDRLPKESGYVLICSNGDDTSMPAYFNKYYMTSPITSRKLYFWWMGEAVQADYWMPLPEPRKENK